MRWKSDIMENKTKFLYSFVFSDALFYSILLSWVVWQLCYVYYGSYDELISDPGFYVYYASECVSHGTIYPDYSNYHDEYIFNPGYINFLVLIIKLTGSTHVVPYLNVVFNLCIVFLTIWLCKLLDISKHATRLIVYAFFALPSFTTIVRHLYSEQLFLLFLLLSICFSLLGKRRYSVGAGIFAAVAVWIRPVALAWIIGAVVFILYKRRYAHCVAYVLSYALTCSVIAISTHAHFPDYIYKAETGGVNMIMGANDFATGGYCGEARRDPRGLGYLEGRYDPERETRVKFYVVDSTYVKRFSERYTYKECDSIYRSRALSWIASNPWKWCKLSYRKIQHTFSTVPSFLYFFCGDFSRWPFRVYDSYVNKTSSILWNVMILFAVFSIMLFWKDMKYLCLLFLPTALYAGMIVITCGAARYNMVLHPFLSILACQAIVVSYRYIRHFVSLTSTHCDR